MTTDTKYPRTEADELAERNADVAAVNGGWVRPAGDDPDAIREGLAIGHEAAEDLGIDPRELGDAALRAFDEKPELLTRPGPTVTIHSGPPRS